MLSDAAANINDRPSSSGLIGQQVPGSGLAAPWQHAVQQGTSDDNASFAEAQTLRFAPAGAVASGLGHRYPSHGSDMSAHGVQQGTSLGAGDAQMRDLLMLVNKLGLRTSSNGTEHSMPQRSSHSNILPSGGMGPQLLSNPSSLPAPLQQQLQQLQQLHNLQRCQLSEMPNMSQAQPSQLQLAQQQLAQQQQQLSQQQQQLTQQQQLNQQQQQLTQQLQAQLGQADAETVMALMSSIGMGSTGQLLGNAQNGGLRSSSGLVLDGSSGLIMDGSGALASRRPMPLGGVGTLNCLSAGGLTNLNGSGNLSGRGLNNLSGSGLNNISGSGLVEERLSAGNMGGSSLPLGGSGVLQEPAAGLTNEQLLDAMQADPALLMNLLAAQQGGSGLHGAGGQAIGVQHAWQPVMDQRQVNWDALSMGAGAGGLANAGLAQHVPLVASMMPQQPQPAIASPLLQHQMLRSAHMQPQPLNLQQLGNTMTATYIAPRAQPMSAPQASHGVAQVSMGMAGMGTMAGLSMPAVSANNYVNLQLAGGGLAQQGVHLTLPHGSNSGALQAGQIANQQQVYWVQSAPMPNYIEVQVAQPQPQVQQLQAVDLLASARERLSSLVASVAAGSGQLRSSVPAAGTPAPSTPATGSGTISAPASSTAAATTATAPPAGDAPPPKLRSQHKLYKVRGKLYKNKVRGCICAGSNVCTGPMVGCSAACCVCMVARALVYILPVGCGLAFGAHQLSEPAAFVYLPAD